MDKKRFWNIQTAKTRNIGARLPNDLWKRLKAFCLDYGCTTTELVCMALESYMNEMEDEKGEREK